MKTITKMEEILVKANEMKILIAEMRELASQEAYELKECEAFQQDLLHILESIRVNASESAKIGFELAKNREKRREIKNGQIMKEKFQKQIDVMEPILDEIIEKNGEFRLPNIYRLRSNKGEEFLGNIAKFEDRRKMDVELLPNEEIIMIHKDCNDESDENTPITLAVDEKDFVIKLKDADVRFKKFKTMVDYLHKERLTIEKIEEEAVKRLNLVETGAKATMKKENLDFLKELKKLETI